MFTRIIVQLFGLLCCLRTMFFLHTQSIFFLNRSGFAPASLLCLYTTISICFYLSINVHRIKYWSSIRKHQCCDHTNIHYPAMVFSSFATPHPGQGLITMHSFTQDKKDLSVKSRCISNTNITYPSLVFSSLATPHPGQQQIITHESSFKVKIYF